MAAAMNPVLTRVNKHGLSATGIVHKISNVVCRIMDSCCHGLSKNLCVLFFLNARPDVGDYYLSNYICDFLNHNEEEYEKALHLFCCLLHCK